MGTCASGSPGCDSLSGPGWTKNQGDQRRHGPPRWAAVLADRSREATCRRLFRSQLSCRHRFPLLSCFPDPVCGVASAPGVGAYRDGAPASGKVQRQSSKQRTAHGVPPPTRSASIKPKFDRTASTGKGGGKPRSRAGDTKVAHTAPRDAQGLPPHLSHRGDAQKELPELAIRGEDPRGPHTHA